MEAFLLIAVTSVAASFPETPCMRIQIREKFYDSEILRENIGRPNNLIMHRPTNTLFYSYSITESYAYVEFQLAYYNMNTKDHQTIPGIRGGCATAVDNANDIVYLGGSHGIYKYNMMTKIADFYKENEKNIWSLFYKNNLFYISYPEQKLYMEIDGKFAIVREFENFEVDQFYITERGDIYFANKTGLYKYDNEKINIQLIDELIVRQIAEDQDGNVYVCTNFGIFVDKVGGMEKIVDLKNVFGLAFDKDNNFIISEEKRIMKLIPSAQGCEE